MSWLGIGNQIHGPRTEMLPLSVDGCSNETLALSSLVTEAPHDVTLTTTLAPTTE